MHAIFLPWSHRERLAFNEVAIYEPRDHMGYPRYSVPVAQYNGRTRDGEVPETVLPFPLKGWAEAVAAFPPGHVQKAIGSKLRPWVRDRDDRWGPGGSDILSRRLDACRMANVGLDRVFDGADLCIHVDAFVFDRDEHDHDGLTSIVTSRAFMPGFDGPKYFLALMGVDILRHNAQAATPWSPIPARRLPQN